MSTELFQLVCAIAGPATMRTFENLRRTLEDMYVKSTAQGATPEEQAAFNPELIAQAHVAARADNAKTIVSWALAIQIELHNADTKSTKIQRLQGYLDTAHDKLAFLQLRPETTAQVIQSAKEDILSLQEDLRDLQESAPEVPGRPSHPWPSGLAPAGPKDLAGDLPEVS
jgi:chromosome segregation ATPase